MEFEIKVKIEGLDQLTESLALIGSAMAYKNNMVKTSSEAVNLMLDVTNKIEDLTEEEKVKKDVVEKVVAEVVQAPEEEKEEEGKEEEVAEEPPAITLEEIRAVFVEKNNIKGNTPKLKAILNEYEVKKVTDLDEKVFEEVLKKLKEL